MTYSVVFALPAAVRTMLLSESALDGVEILTGPRRVAAGTDSLAIQETRSTASRPVTGGVRREEGTFTIRAHVETTGAGEDAIDAARGRCDDLLEAASTVLEADCTVGGMLLHCDFTEVAEDDQALDQSGREYTAHAIVSFRADVYPGA